MSCYLSQFLLPVLISYILCHRTANKNVFLYCARQGVLEQFLFLTLQSLMKQSFFLIITYPLSFFSLHIHHLFLAKIYCEKEEHLCAQPMLVFIQTFKTTNFFFRLISFFFQQCALVLTHIYYPQQPSTPTMPIISAPSDLGVNFDIPAQFTPSLDNSAARHRMSVKPRNQRASAKVRKLTLVRSRTMCLFAKGFLKRLVNS